MSFLCGFHCTIIFSSVSAGSDDLCVVQEYLGSKRAKCYAIGSALGLDQNRLDNIQSECVLNNTKAMRTIINDWLKKNYNTERHGPPTWKALVKAVKSPIGGDDTELAEKIAKDHPAQPSEERNSEYSACTVQDKLLVECIRSIVLI